MRPSDEHILDLAEEQTIDVAGLAVLAAEYIEEDDAFNRDHVDVDPAGTMADAVRLDIFRILARKFGTAITIKQFIGALKHESIREQLALIADAERRIECIRAVYRDLADDAFAVVLTKQGMFDGLHAGIREDEDAMIECIRKYRTLLAMRLCLV